MSKENLSDNLKKLSDITNWFEEREDLDIEESLRKVKEAAEIIKKSRKRLKEIENEFEEIKEDIEKDSEEMIDVDR